VGAPFFFATKFQKFAKKIIAEILDLYPVKRFWHFFWQISYLKNLISTCTKDFLLEKGQNLGKPFTSCQIHVLKVPLHSPHYKGMLNFFLMCDL
jgi:hypothetical protein